MDFLVDEQNKREKCAVHSVVSLRVSHGNGRTIPPYRIISRELK